MRLQRNQEIDCGFRNHLGLAIWFSKTEPTLLLPVLFLASASEPPLRFLSRGPKLLFQPATLCQAAVAPLRSGPLNTYPCSTFALRPPRALLFGGARLLHPAAPLCQPPFRTLSSGPGSPTTATGSTPSQSVRSFEGARLLRSAAPSVNRLLRPFSSRSGPRLLQMRPAFDFGKPSAEGRGFYVFAALFVNLHFGPDISPANPGPGSPSTWGTNRTKDLFARRVYSVVCGVSPTPDPLPNGAAPAQHLPARQDSVANAAGNTPRATVSQRSGSDRWSFFNGPSRSDSSRVAAGSDARSLAHRETGASAYRSYSWRFRSAFCGQR